MVLSLLCETEDKIFISYCFVSTLEKRFCNFYNVEGQSFLRSSARNFLSSFECVRPHVNVYCVSCRAGDKEIRREKNRERRPKSDEDGDRQTELSYGPLLFGHWSRCHQNLFVKKRMLPFP